MATVGKKGKSSSTTPSTGELSQASDSKRFKQETKSTVTRGSSAGVTSGGRSGSHSTSGSKSASGKSRIPQAVSGGTAASHKHGKASNEKKDGCCIKSSSTSSQSLKDQGAAPVAPSSAPQRSPRSSIFTRFLHRQGHGSSAAGGQANVKGSGCGTSSSKPKSPKSRSSESRLRIFNRSSSLKEVKISFPSSSKPTTAKPSSQQYASKSSTGKQAAVHIKPQAKVKEPAKPTKVFPGVNPPQKAPTNAGRAPKPPAGDPPETRQEAPSSDHVTAPAANEGSAARTKVDAEDDHLGAETMETSTKTVVSKSRRDCVQAWVNSISDDRLNGAEDMDHPGAAAGGAEVAIEMTSADEVGAGQEVKPEEDELTLGAEAKLLTPPKTVLSRATKDRLLEAGAAGGDARSAAWRNMFSQLRTDSFNSEGSAHSVRTWDSIDQLLNERTGDPVEILTNLGFHSQESDDSLPARIPERFLRQQSVANGISVEHFIESHSDLREYMALTRPTSEPSASSVASERPASRKTSQQRKTSHSTMSLASLVRTMTFIHRLTSHMSWKEIDLTKKMLMPKDSATARLQSVSYTGVSPKGRAYKSILHPDNSEHLAEQGVYDDIPEHVEEPPAKVRSLSAQRWSSVLKPKLSHQEDTSTSNLLGVDSAHRSPSERNSIASLGVGVDTPKSRSGTASPIPSPARPGSPSQSDAAEMSWRQSLSERIPQRFTPSPTFCKTEAPDNVHLSSDEESKQQKLSPPSPGESKGSSLWKKLSTSSLQGSDAKSESTLPAPLSKFDISKSASFPNIPLRFLTHSHESVLNGLKTDTDGEEEVKPRSRSLPGTYSKPCGPLSEGEREAITNSLLQKAQEEPQKPHAEKDAAVMETSLPKACVSVFVMGPSLDEEDMDTSDRGFQPSDQEAAQPAEQEEEHERPTRLPKRKHTSGGDRQREELASDQNRCPDYDEPKRLRRKLGSVCVESDQLKLLEILGSKTDNDDSGETWQYRTGTECDSDQEITSLEELPPPRHSVSSEGFADDEMDSRAEMTRRERASKTLRKYLSQAEEEAGEEEVESDSDDSVSEPAQTVIELGTAVMLASAAQRVQVKCKTTAAVQPESQEEEDEAEEEEEVLTTDRGSISGDDVDYIYGEILAEKKADYLSLITNEGHGISNDLLHVGEQMEAVPEKLQKSSHIRRDSIEPIYSREALGDTSPPNENAMHRRWTVCTAPMMERTLENGTTTKVGAKRQERWSDHVVRYESLSIANKRHRFSRQENVEAQDMPCPHSTEDTPGSQVATDSSQYTASGSLPCDQGMTLNGSMPSESNAEYFSDVPCVGDEPPELSSTGHLEDNTLDEHSFTVTDNMPELYPEASVDMESNEASVDMESNENTPTIQSSCRDPGFISHEGVSDIRLNPYGSVQSSEVRKGYDEADMDECDNGNQPLVTESQTTTHEYYTFPRTEDHDTNGIVGKSYSGSQNHMLDEVSDSLGSKCDVSGYQKEYWPSREEGQALTRSEGWSVIPSNIIETDLTVEKKPFKTVSSETPRTNELRSEGAFAFNDGVRFEKASVDVTNAQNGNGRLKNQSCAPDRFNAQNQILSETVEGTVNDSVRTEESQSAVYNKGKGSESRDEAIAHGGLLDDKSGKRDDMLSRDRNCNVAISPQAEEGHLSFHLDAHQTQMLVKNGGVLGSEFSCDVRKENVGNKEQEQNELEGIYFNEQGGCIGELQDHSDRYSQVPSSNSNVVSDPCSATLSHQYDSACGGENTSRDHVMGCADYRSGSPINGSYEGSIDSHMADIGCLSLALSVSESSLRDAPIGYVELDESQPSAKYNEKALLLPIKADPSEYTRDMTSPNNGNLNSLDSMDVMEGEPHVMYTGGATDVCQASVSSMSDIDGLALTRRTSDLPGEIQEQAAENILVRSTEGALPATTLGLATPQSSLFVDGDSSAVYTSVGDAVQVASDTSLTSQCYQGEDSIETCSHTIVSHEDQDQNGPGVIEMDIAEQKAKDSRTTDASPLVFRSEDSGLYSGPVSVPCIEASCSISQNYGSASHSDRAVQNTAPSAAEADTSHVYLQFECHEKSTDIDSNREPSAVIDVESDPEVQTAYDVTGQCAVNEDDINEGEVLETTLRSVGNVELDDEDTIIQGPKILVLSLSDSSSSDEITQEGDRSKEDGEVRDALLVATHPSQRRLSLVRFTESDRDDSLRCDSRDEECVVYHEKLVDDNVLDRSLSEHGYLEDLLVQLRRNQINMEHLPLFRRRSSSEASSLSRRFSSISQQGATDESSGRWDFSYVNMQSEKRLSRSGPSEGTEISQDRDKEMEAQRRDSLSKVKNSKLLLGLTEGQQSFDLEEISSEDSFKDTLPDFRSDRTNAKAARGGYTRAFSGQSDSSGFAEMESTEIDWSELKVARLGSSADSESSSQDGTSTSPKNRPVRARPSWEPYRKAALSSQLPVERTKRKSISDTSGSPGQAQTSISLSSIRCRPLLPGGLDSEDTDSTMGAAETTLKATEEERLKSRDEDHLWEIVENGHPITEKDFLFGAPHKTGGKERGPSTKRSQRRRSRRHLDPVEQWVSRVYIDPPVPLPKVTPSSKMEVNLVVEQGRIKSIENARALPLKGESSPLADPSQQTSQQRCVSYLHLCVTKSDEDLKIRPVDKGDFLFPQYPFDYEGKMDVSQHQVLCSLLRRPSFAWAPDNETDRQCKLWSSSEAGSRREQFQYLLEEVKLVQQAITKFKVEFRALDVRTNAIYQQRPETLTTEQKTELTRLRDLRCQIEHEIKELERSLAERLQTIMAGDACMLAGDLANLNTIHQVVEVLKEQVYHSSVVNGLDLVPEGATYDQNQYQQHQQVPFCFSDLQVASKGETDLVGQLEAIQRQLAEQQAKATATMTDALQELKHSLLREVRESVQKENEQLRQQVKDTKNEVLELREKLRLYTGMHVGTLTDATTKAEVRFPVGTPTTNDSPPGWAVTEKWTTLPTTQSDTSSTPDQHVVTETHYALEVSQRNRVEASPLESAQLPLDGTQENETNL